MAWWMVPAGLSIANNIMNRNAVSKPPPQFNYQPPAQSGQQGASAPSYQAMARPQQQGISRTALPQYQSMPQPQQQPITRTALPQYQAPSAQQTPVYNQLTSQLTQGQTFLPENYRNAVMGQVSREMGQYRDQDRARVMEEANKYNLLNSGSLGVQLGMVEDNYSKQMANAMDSLTQQEFAARQAGVQQALGLESQGREFGQRNFEQGRDLDFQGVTQQRGFEQQGYLQNQQLGQDWASRARDLDFEGVSQQRSFEQQGYLQDQQLGQQWASQGRDLDQANYSQQQQLAQRDREIAAQQAFDAQRMNYLAQLNQVDAKNQNRQALFANLMKIPEWMQAAGMAGG